jgi:hypothetical protein
MAAKIKLFTLPEIWQLVNEKPTEVRYAMEYKRVAGEPYRVYGKTRLWTTQQVELLQTYFRNNNRNHKQVVAGVIDLEKVKMVETNAKVRDIDE